MEYFLCVCLSINFEIMMIDFDSSKFLLKQYVCKKYWGKNNSLARSSIKDTILCNNIGEHNFLFALFHSNVLNMEINIETPIRTDVISSLQKPQTVQYMYIGP
jgi:hypothetical protein